MDLQKYEARRQKGLFIYGYAPLIIVLVTIAVICCVFVLLFSGKRQWAIVFSILGMCGMALLIAIYDKHRERSFKIYMIAVLLAIVFLFGFAIKLISMLFQK